MNEKTKKIVIWATIAVVSILVLFIGISIIKNIFFNDETIIDSMDLSSFDNSTPIVIQENNKYGYISTNGKVLIEPKYKNATQFHGNYALVTERNDEGTRYIIIDKKGKEKISAESVALVEYIEGYDIWVIENKLYDKNLKQLSGKDMRVEYEEKGYSYYKDESNNTVGIMNSEGKSIYKYNLKEQGGYAYISIHSENQINDEVYASFSIVDSGERKSAIINCKNGKVVYDYVQNDIYAEENNIFNIYSKDDYGTKLGTLYIEDGKAQYEVEEDAAIEFYNIENKILEINYKDDRKAYYNLDTKETYTDLEQLSLDEDKNEELVEGTRYLIYKDDIKYGIKLKDKVVLNAEYERIDFLPFTIYTYLEKENNSKLVLLTKEGTTILYDLNRKKELFTFETTLVDTDYESSFILAYNKDDKGYTVYNTLTKKSMDFDEGSEITKYGNYIIVKKDNVETYYNTKFKEIYKIDKNN